MSAVRGFSPDREGSTVRPWIPWRGWFLPLASVGDYRGPRERDSVGHSCDVRGVCFPGCSSEVATRQCEPGPLRRLRIGLQPPGCYEVLHRVAALTREVLAGLHSNYWKPGSSALVISGDVPLAEAPALATMSFGSWTGGAAPEVPFPPQTPAPAG